MRSEVRVFPGPPFLPSGDTARGHSSVGRAPALQAGGRRFDSVWLHQLSPLRGFGSASRRCRSTVAPLQNLSLKAWWSQTGSNRRPPACKAGALPTELWPRSRRKSETPERVVGLGRLELPTSRLSSARSNQLSYKPKNPRSQEDLAVRKDQWS